MRRAGVLPIAPELLQGLFKLPDHLRITGAEWNVMSATVELLLEGPYCPEVAEGARPPLIGVVYRRHPASGEPEVIEIQGLDT